MTYFVILLFLQNSRCAYSLPS